MSWQIETNKQYHENAGINPSYLSKLFQWKTFIPMQKSIYQPTEAMKLGTALHLSILQPDIAGKAISVFSGSKRSNAGKEEYKQLTEAANSANEAVVITESQNENLQEMVKSIKANRIAVELLNGAFVEQSAYIDFTLRFPNKYLEDTCPKRFKCKIDARKPGIIIDVKTTSTKNIADFQQSIEDYNYEMQAYHNLLIANNVETLIGSKIKYEQFWMIIVQSVEPYECLCLEMSEFDLMIGQHKWWSAYRIFEKYYQTGDLSNLLDCPSWKAKRYDLAFQQELTFNL